MRLLKFILILISTQGLLAQKGPVEFGDVSIEDFNIKTTEPSVVLFNKGEFVYPDYKRHIRIKINSKEAFNLWGNFKLDNELGRILSIKAATYFLEDGKIVTTKVENEAILDDRKHSNEKNVILPNLREGCIVELAFKTTLPGAIPYWTIQTDARVLWSEFQLASPILLTYSVRGNIRPALVDLHYKSSSRWIFKNVPAHKVEPLMPPYLKNYARLEFWEHTSTWQEISQKYRDAYFIEKKKFPSRNLKNTTARLTANLTDPVEKAKAIRDFVMNNTSWVEEFGPSANVNELMFNMLEFADLSPSLVMLSTKQNGPIDKALATEDQFNYLLCHLTVGAKNYFLDATNRYLPFGTVPTSCLNTTGFLIDKYSFRWIDVTQINPSQTLIRARLSVGEQQSLSGKIVVVLTGYAAYAKAQKDEEEVEKTHAKFVVPNSVLLDSTAVEHTKNDNIRLTEIYNGSIGNNVVESGDKIFVSPWIVENDDEDAWKDQDRQLPIDLSVSAEKSVVVTLAIPTGYKVEAVPQDRKFVIQDKSITCSFKTTYNDKFVVVSYHYTNTRTLFDPKEYQQLREFNNLILARRAEQIIFTR